MFRDRGRLLNGNFFIANNLAILSQVLKAPPHVVENARKFADILLTLWSPSTAHLTVRSWNASPRSF